MSAVILFVAKSEKIFHNAITLVILIKTDLHLLKVAPIQKWLRMGKCEINKKFTGHRSMLHLALKQVSPTKSG